jgi:hypothetical protein
MYQDVRQPGALHAILKMPFESQQRSLVANLPVSLLARTFERQKEEV